MKIRIATTVVGVAAGLLVAAAPPAPDGFEYVPTEITVYNAIGCDQADDGTTCDSTQYYLSTAPGQDNVGSTFSFTPVGSAFYYADGGYTYDVFSPGDGVSGETYVIDASRDLTGQVTLSGFVSPVNAAVDAGVGVIIKLRYTPEGATKAKTVSLTATVDKPVMTPTDNVFAYTIDIPDELDGVEAIVSSMEVGQRGVNVATSGFMNGSGQSYFELPYYYLMATGA